MADESQTGPDQATKGPARRAVGERRNEHRQRINYISMRLAEIPLRVKEYAGEREQLTSNLKTRPDEKSDEVKKLRVRREYLATRIAQLREEQSSLNAERKLSAEAGGQKGRGDKGKAAQVAAEA